MAGAYPSAQAISEGTLDAAVEGGLLSAEQARGLRELEGSRASALAAPSPDDEQFRFISGFADIFVTIGLLLFLGALGYLALVSTSDPATGAILAAASWLLAEYFTRRRRMALPSIVLLVIFASSVFVGLSLAIEPDFNSLLDDSPDRTGTIVASLATVVAAALHYWRFRVPITIAAGVAALVIAARSGIETVLPDFDANWVLLVLGVLVFALAMRFDLSDPMRLTRRTDIAFWLHMLAAPLIVHPLVGGLLASNGSELTTGAAWGILGVFAALSVVALLVDRRAVLVSGLTYAGIAFGTIAGQAGLLDNAIPLAVLVLGALVLLLSAGWHLLRRALLRLLPTNLSGRLPAAA